MTSGRRSKALRRAYERRETSVSERKPGERGYAAYWRQEFGNASPEIRRLKQQLDGTLSGRAIVGVMNVYGGRINNESGRSQLSQQKIADLSGYGVRSVKRVQRWATEHGWAEKIANGAAGKVGKTMEMRVGWLPAEDATCGPIEAEDTCGPVDPTCRPVEADMGASSGLQTLIQDSHLRLSYPCFCHGETLCPDEQAEDTATPSGPLPTEPLSNQGQTPEVESVEMCEFHVSYPADECRYCDRPARGSNAPEWKKKQWHEDHLERNEGLDRIGEPLEEAAPVSRPRSRTRL